MRLIDADALLNALGIGEGGDCEKCNYNSCDLFCGRGKDFVDACKAICDAPTIESENIDELKLMIEELKAHIDYLNRKNENMCGEIKALAYAVRVNGVSGNEVPYEAD